MSYNGSGTFVINTSGQPVVTGTVISSTAFNALTADLGTGLSTAITKDGQTTTTAKIPFAQGISAAVASNFAAGTVAAPAIYLSTDTGTGLYRIGANNDGFAISGTKLLDFGSALLGITGAATISTTLGVTGITTLGAAIVGPATATVFNSVSTTVNAFGAASTALNMGHASATNTLLGVSNFSQGVNGTLGATTPAAATVTTLSASGVFTSTATGNLLLATAAGTGFKAVNLSNTSGNAYFGVEGSPGGQLYGTAYATMILAAAGKNIESVVGPSIITTVSSTGLAVTGTLSATGNLTLSSATAAIAMGTAAGYGYIGNSTSAAYLEFDGASHATTPNQAFLRADNYSFKTVAGTTILNASSGAVAVTGTLSATGTFTGNGIGGNIFSGSVSGAGTYMAEVRNTNATASSATTAFTCALTGASDMTNARFITFYDADGQASAIGSISVASATTVAYNTSSDGRLKESVQDFTGALDILAKVQPRSFVWKKDGKQDYGFIAQELREVYPYPVSGKGEPDDVLLQMDYGRITPLLAAAIKELAAKVAKLEAA